MEELPIRVDLALCRLEKSKQLKQLCSLKSLNEVTIKVMKNYNNNGRRKIHKNVRKTRVVY